MSTIESVKTALSLRPVLKLSQDDADKLFPHLAVLQASDDLCMCTPRQRYVVNYAASRIARARLADEPRLQHAFQPANPSRLPWSRSPPAETGGLMQSIVTFFIVIDDVDDLLTALTEDIPPQELWDDAQTRATR